MTLKFDGRIPLKGFVSPSGSVYSALSLICAGVFFEESILENVPLVPVVKDLLKSLEKFGITSEWVSPNTISIITKEPILENIDNSALVIPLLIRGGRVSLVAGTLSSRTIQFYQSLGVVIEEASAGLTTAIFGGLDTPSIDAEHSLEFSITALLLASKAISPININNFLITEETLDLIEFLKEAGGSIVLDPKDGEKLIISEQTPVTTVKFSLPPSSLESVFWASAAIMSGGDIVIKSASKDRLISYFSKLSTLGAHFEFDGLTVRVWQDAEHVLKPLDFEVSKELPLYDFLPLLIPVLLLASGESKISGLNLDKEPYIKDLNLFNAKIMDGKIIGPAALKGAKVAVNSFVEGLSVILLALGANGKSEILEAEKVTDYIGDLVPKLEQLLGKPVQI